MHQGTGKIDLDSLARVLGVPVTACASELRAAYLQKVQQHPPDRDPELFEQIRDAYEQLRTPGAQDQAVLEGPDPVAPSTDLLKGMKESRNFDETTLWTEILKGNRR